MTLQSLTRAVEPTSFFDDVETGVPQFGTLKVSTAAKQLVTLCSQFYFAEFRGSDKYTQTGPYSFYGDGITVEHPYQDGLLVWYWDTSFSATKCSTTAGTWACGGIILPVDAHLSRSLAGLGNVSYRYSIV
jgi:hypothetical protein